MECSKVVKLVEMEIKRKRNAALVSSTLFRADHLEVAEALETMLEAYKKQEVHHVEDD